MGMFTKLLGIDRNDLVAVIGGDAVTFGVGADGKPWRMPAYVAVHSATKRVLAVGEEAEKMLGREPGNITVVRFVRHGGFGVDFDLAEAAMRYAIRSRGRPLIVAPRLVLVCPHEQKMVVQTATIHACVREIIHIRPAMAAALGAGLAVDAPQIRAVFVLERDWCAFALISLSGFVAEFELPLGIDDLLEEVALHALATRNVVLDPDELHDRFLASGLGGGDLLGWETWLDELETGRVATTHYSESDLARTALPFMLRLRSHYRRALGRMDKAKLRDGASAPLHFFSPYAKLAGVTELVGRAFKGEITAPAQGETAMVRGGQFFLRNIDNLLRVAVAK